VEEKSKTLLFRGTRLGDQGTEEKDNPGNNKENQESVKFH
jgi:hypothetical protein